MGQIAEKTSVDDGVLGIIPHEDSFMPYKTYDLGVSAALLCENFELYSVDKENPRKAQFVFKKDAEIEEIADRYFSDRLEVRARSYFDQLKALKNKLYSD